MRVLLRDDVPGTGRRGDIVDVAGGFARNYLLPQGRAILATPGLSDQAAAMRKRRDLREAQDRQAAESQASILAGTVVRVPARAAAGGRLFGSIGAAEVAAALAAATGVELDRRSVAIDEPFKEVGSFEVPVHLFADVSTFITVEVVAAG
jgi:large subunit ribosomal protein L9